MTDHPDDLPPQPFKARVEAASDDPTGIERLDRIAGLIVDARQLIGTLGEEQRRPMQSTVDCLLMQVGTALARELRDGWQVKEASEDHPARD